MHILLIKFILTYLILITDSSQSLEINKKDFISKQTVFYVATNGNDNNPGTKELPWRTIRKGANQIKPGETLIVKAGFYNEYVIVKKGGTAEDKRITIKSEKQLAAKCMGFNLQGDYITIDGFDIEASTVNWTGVQSRGNSHLNILNCYIHECPTVGIKITHMASYAKIIGNKLEHNGQSGISYKGTHGLIENNVITKTVQHHPKGHEPGFSGADADGMRIFGSNHIIRSNSVLDIGDPNDKGNIDPHVDGIQSWDGGPKGYPIMSNTIIEGNYFRIKHPSGKGIIMEANKGGSGHHLIIRNNIFEFRDIGISMYSGRFNDIFIYNNIFKANLNEKSWGTSMCLVNVNNYQVSNNITVDCHPEHRKIKGGKGIIDYNIAWNSDGSAPRLIPDLQPNELKGVDPGFVTYTGNSGESDYHLKPTSPAIDAGKGITDLLVDFEGTKRPEGKKYDIGPFEYKKTK
jgi:hypothetical protein